MRRFSPETSPFAKAIIRDFIAGANGLSPGVRAPLVTRYDHVYGALDGQRALTDDTMQQFGVPRGQASQKAKYSFIIALETYFASVCNLISASALTPDPSKFLKTLSDLNDNAFDEKLSGIVGGHFHLEHGIQNFANTVELDWFVKESLPQSTRLSFRQLIIGLSYLWSTDGLCNGATDPMQLLHDAVFPKSLMHVTGQFYTPPWLAELLLSDMSWDHEGTLIDPFCGSGAFLVTAIKMAKLRGADPIKLLPRLCGIDLSPTASIAARTNLILSVIASDRRRLDGIAMNIFCADTLAPAVIEGERLQSPLLPNRRVINIDGETIDFDASTPGEMLYVSQALKGWGFSTKTWLDVGQRASSLPSKPVTNRDRKIVEQLGVFLLKKADFLTTNPPWVGWEYISRPYRDMLNPAWNVYSLFDQKGIQAAFLKEDLSTLCFQAACDRFLRVGGRASIVIRPSAMKSDLASRGVRRLSVFADSGFLKLERIREFEDLHIFEGAATPAATWQLLKGEPTVFPVRVDVWHGKKGHRHPPSTTTLNSMRLGVEESELVCNPVDPSDSKSRWATNSIEAEINRGKIGGVNNLKPRIGFFTGGANAVYYLKRLERVSDIATRFANITERAKRFVDNVTAPLEDELIYSVLRGRDLSFWASNPEVFVLCAHSAQTKMRPFEYNVLSERFPLAAAYFDSMRDVLESRKGFAGWEGHLLKEYFYTLQRIGDYTFAPFKVCWSYIAADFVIAVIGPDENGKPIFPNDKVVFLPFDDEDAAYFTAGILSSSPIRAAVVSSVSARQVSANVIRHYAIPNFGAANRLHRQISDHCRLGHSLMRMGDVTGAAACYSDLNASVAELLGLSRQDISATDDALKRMLGFFPFHRKAGLRRE